MAAAQDNVEIVHFTAGDGYRLAVRRWPAELVRGRIVLLHGIVSHGGWYDASCRALCDAGFEVHFLERRGSGLNRRSRGDVDRFTTWIDDVERYLESLPSDRPRLLMGISWGGKLAAAVARERPELISGVALLCPGLFAWQMPSPLKMALLRLLRRCGLGSLRVPIPLRDPALFTGEPRWQQFIAGDPLALWRVTVRFAVEDRRLTRYATESPESIRVPLLIVLAGRDRIVKNDAVRAFFQRVGSSQKQLLEYASAAHTLEFEPDPTAYFADLVDWCSRIAQTAASRQTP